jgi:hypothetical protein
MSRVYNNVISGNVILGVMRLGRIEIRFGGLLLFYDKEGSSIRFFSFLFFVGSRTIPISCEECARVCYNTCRNYNLFPRDETRNIGRASDYI